MGYYVNIDEADFVIPARNLDVAYQAMCELNKYDELKTGGSFSGGVQTAKWFSWMDENYPETCKDAEAIFQALGFDTVLTESGDLRLVGYDSKAGAEHHFLRMVAPLVNSGSFIVWRGEDGDMWRHEFNGGKMEEKTAKITWE